MRCSVESVLVTNAMPLEWTLFLAGQSTKLLTSEYPASASIQQPLTASRRMRGEAGHGVRGHLTAEHKLVEKMRERSCRRRSGGGALADGLRSLRRHRRQATEVKNGTFRSW